MPSLTTSYLDLSLASPLVASASPLTGRLDTLRQLEDAGASAAVLPSVFEEQLHQEMAFMDHYLTVRSNILPESQSFFPDPDLYNFKTDKTLDLIRDAKDALDIPVIASLNGSTPEGWSDFAIQMQEAGADAIELNLYQVAADPSVSGEDLESRQVDTVRDVVSALEIPVTVKIGSHYSALANMAEQFEAAGAGGLVLFNRFYQPDFDIHTRTVTRTLELSTSREMLLPMSWIAILRSQLKLNLAATTGVHTAEDVIKYLMAGADIVCTTSALLKHGPEKLRDFHKELETWLDQNEYPNLDDLRGCMRREYVDNPELFERANYIKLLSGYDHPAN